MKKILSFALTGLIFSLVACQREEISAGGEEILQTISVSIPQGEVQTRATSEAGNGAQVDRCIMEIYHHGELYYKKIVGVTGTTAEFKDIRLVTSQSYDFLFWADNSGENHADEYYNTADGLMNITYVENKYIGNNDELDAFSYATTQTITSEFAFNDWTLTRPFAQLNVETTDITADMIANHPELLPQNVKVKFASVPSKFNVLTGTATENAALTYTAKVTKDVDGNYLTGAKNGALLTVDYIFTANATEQDLINFTAEFQKSDGTAITSNDKFNNIPVKRNFKTNVFGNLLTANGSVTVTIDPVFTTPNIDRDIQSAQNTGVANATLANNSSDINIAVLDAPATAEASTITIPANYDAGNDNQIGLTLPALTDGALTYTIDVPATGQNSKVAPDVLTITIAEGDKNKVVVNAPASTVYINGKLQSLTAEVSQNTLIVTEDGVVETLTVNQGGVEIYGQVKTLNFAATPHETNPATLKVYTVYDNNQWSKAIELKSAKIILGANVTLAVGDAAKTASLNMPVECLELDLNEKALNAGQLNWEETCNLKIANGTLNLYHENVALYLKAANSKFNLEKVVLNAPNAYTTAIMARNIAGNCELNISNSTITVDNEGQGIVYHGPNSNIIITDSEIVHDYIGITQNGTDAGSSLTVKNTEITGPYSAIYLSNSAKNPKNTLLVDECTLVSNTTSPIEVKKTNIKVVNSTLESKYTNPDYALNPGGTGGAGHGIILAGYADEPSYYEGTTEFANNTYTLAGAGSNGGAEEIYVYNGVSYDGADTYYIYNKDGMYWVAEQTAAKNTFAGKNVTLFQDIYFAEGEQWAPIGGTKTANGTTTIDSYPGDSFNGTFNGNNHRIVGMNVSSTGEENATAGLFGAICGVVKDLIIDNATVVSDHYAGAILGYSSANTGMKVENCHVVNSTITSNVWLNATKTDGCGDKAGGIIGYCVAGDEITNCTVENTTITAYRDLGGIVGYTAANISGCQVLEGVKLVITWNAAEENYKGYKTQDEHDAGSIVGENHGNVTNCTGTATIEYKPFTAE